MAKETIIRLMLDKFPEMKKYLHLLNWESHDQGDDFGISAKIPEPLATQLEEWQKTYQGK